MASPAFGDHFSHQAEIYARYRPGYPDSLFEFLASVSPSRNQAWDCATGNGQAAKGLARYFSSVIATDGSKEQLLHAFPDPRIEYRTCLAEDSGLPDHSIDGITVATSAHWFDIDAFYKEVRRVSVPQAILAIWGTGWFKVIPEIDEITKEFAWGTLKEYWPKGAEILWGGYRDLPFPFEPIPHPDFNSEAEWDVQHFEGFLMSWSPVQAYIRKHHRNPAGDIMPDIISLWGNGKRKVVWNLNLKLGRVN